MEEPNLLQMSIRQYCLKYLLDRAAGAVGRRYPYYLIRVYLTRVEVIATNLDTTVIAEYIKQNDDGMIVDMGGSICVPAKKFQAIIDALPDTFIAIEVLPGNSVQIICGDYSGVLPCVDPCEHFPTIDIPDSPPLVIEADLIPDIYSACRHAISKDESKIMLAGFHLRTDNGRLLGCACDGHRLALAAKTLDTEIPLDRFATGVTLPARMCAELVKIKAGFVELRLTDNQLSITARGITVITRLLDGDYPDYRRVIPTTHKQCCVTNTAQLATITERVSILSESGSVLLDIAPGNADGGDIKIETENSAGTISDLVPAEIEGNAVQIRLSPGYLIDALKSIGKTSEDTIVKYGDELCGIVLLPADHSGWDERVEVIMPKRS